MKTTEIQPILLTSNELRYEYRIIYIEQFTLKESAEKAKQIKSIPGLVAETSLLSA